MEGVWSVKNFSSQRKSYFYYTSRFPGNWKKMPNTLKLLTISVLLSPLLWLGLLTPVSSQTNTAESDNIRITTFNIHYTSPRQKKLAWGNRREAVKEAIADLDADIIAFQEMETFAGGSYNQKNEQLDWVPF